MANSTWNPADLLRITLGGSNLLATQNAANGGVRSVDFQTTGKYYWEYTCTNVQQSTYSPGIANASAALGTVNSSGGVNACIVNLGGNLFLNGSAAPGGINIGTLPFSTHGQICCALDMTAKLFWMRNTGAGVWNNGGTANPATGVGGIDISPITSTGIYALFCTGTNGPAEATTANFGDSAFNGAVPAGFTSGFPAGGGAAAVQARVAILA